MIDETSQSLQAATGRARHSSPLASAITLWALALKAGGSTSADDGLAALRRGLGRAGDLLGWTPVALVELARQRSASTAAPVAGGTATAEDLLALLNEATSLAPRVTDRRAIWLLLMRLLQDTGASVEAARDALDRGAFPPRSYFLLGEASRGVRLMRQALEPRALAPAGPYDDAPVVHVTLARLVTLEETGNALGTELVDRIRQHLAGCPACAAAAEAVQSRSVESL